MDDKERLEEIKRLDVSLLKGTKFYKHWKWLIEQWELNEKAFADLDSEYIDMAQQNNRYREALEFYASKETHEHVLRSESVYENGICISPPDIEPPVIYFDKGEEARKALEGETE